MGNRITVFLTEFLRNMASGGAPMMIISDEDSVDDDIDSQTASTKRIEDDNPNPAISKQTKTKYFEGLKAQQLMTFFEAELQSVTVEVTRSESRGKEYVKLSSSNPTLLATEKHKLEELLQGVMCEEMEITSQILHKVDDIMRSNHLKLIVSDLRNDKVEVHFQDKSEFERLKRLLNPSNSNRRRDRTFGNSVSGKSNPEASEQSDSDLYNGESKWQSHSGSLNAEKNIFNYLGENAQVKLEIIRNGIKTKIYQGSITRARVDAIVNAANEHLDNCGGVAEVISKAAGPEMENECREKMKRQSKIRVSENIITRAGKLPCSWIIHAVGPRWSSYDDKEKALEDLYRTVVNILNAACEHNFVSVVMPPISSGIFAVPAQACAAMYVRALLDFSEKRQGSKPAEFHIIDMKSDVLDLVCTEYRESDEKGRERLFPRNVIERLGIRPRSTVWANQQAYEMSGAKNTKEGSANTKHNFGHFPKRRLRENGQGKFTVEDKLEVLVYTGNILDLRNVSILVCAEGREAKISGRIAKTVLEKANKNQRKKLEALLSGLKLYSDVKQIDFGIDNYKMVFFAIMKRFGNNRPRQEDLTLLKNTTTNVLVAANKKKKNNKSEISLAMPLLGTGSTSTTEYLQKYANVVCDCILDISEQINGSTRLKTIHVVNFHQAQTDSLITAFQTRCSSKQGHDSSSIVKGFNPDSKRSRFDPSGYELEDTWKPISKSQYNFESCIENVKEDSQAKQRTSVENKKDGNLVIIDSDDEEMGSSMVDTPTNAGKAEDDDVENENSICIICMDDKMEDPVMLKACRHKFCRNCIKEYFSHKPACPVCNIICGEIFGNQPIGTAKIYRDSAFLPGQPCSTIIIHYEIPDGIQTEEHPNPNVQYTGLSRQAYLPDNPDGRSVLGLLKKAFEHRLIFTVGFSRTSGKDDVVTWNDIHHKTRREGGPEKFGYPDPEYLERVKEELAAKGITN